MNSTLKHAENCNYDYFLPGKSPLELSNLTWCCALHPLWKDSSLRLACSAVNVEALPVPFFVLWRSCTKQGTFSTQLYTLFTEIYHCDNNT